MSVSIHLYLQCTVFFQSPNFKRLQIIVNACILLYYMSKVYSFCFLFFYFICSTYVTREQPPGATFPFSRAKLQKINEICNLILQNIFYRVNFTWSIKGEILVIHNHIILSLLLTQTLNIGKHGYRYYHFSTISQEHSHCTTLNSKIQFLNFQSSIFEFTDNLSSYYIFFLLWANLQRNIENTTFFIYKSLENTKKTCNFAWKNGFLMTRTK